MISNGYSVLDADGQPTTYGDIYEAGSPFFVLVQTDADVYRLTRYTSGAAQGKHVVGIRLPRLESS